MRSSRKVSLRRRRLPIKNVSLSALVRGINLPEHFYTSVLLRSKCFESRRGGAGFGEPKINPDVSQLRPVAVGGVFHNQPLNRRRSPEPRVSVGRSVFAYSRLWTEIELGVKRSTVITRPGERRAD